MVRHVENESKLKKWSTLSTSPFKLALDGWTEWVFGLLANSQLDYQVKGIETTQSYNDHDALFEIIRVLEMEIALVTQLEFNSIIALKAEWADHSIAKSKTLIMAALFCFYCRKEIQTLQKLFHHQDINQSA